MSSVVYFRYNGLGERTHKWRTTLNTTTETQYTLDVAGGLPHAIVETSEEQTSRYLTGLAQQQDTAWVYQHPDGLGSVRHLSDASAEVSLLQSYDPFGTLNQQSGPGASGFGYTGEQEDANNGLVFLRARYYDPSVGRFVSKDPWPGTELRPQSMNGWNYVEGNPINRTDPSGYQTGCDENGYCPDIDRYLCSFTTSGYDSRGLPCIVNPENFQVSSISPPVYTTPAPCNPTTATNVAWIYCQDDTDLTNWLYRELIEAVTLSEDIKILRKLNAPTAFLHEQLLAYEGWASLVRDDHRYDFKHAIQREFSSKRFLFRRSDHTPYSAEYSIPGNIFYGYVGRSIGFLGGVLHGFAGYAEGTDPSHIGDENYYAVRICDREIGFYYNPTWRHTFNDDPTDYNAVEFGIQLWDNYRERLTESQFVRELEQSVQQFAPVPIEYGGNAYGWKNPRGTWPYHVGYFKGSIPSWLFDPPTVE